MWRRAEHVVPQLNVETKFAIFDLSRSSMDVHRIGRRTRTCYWCHYQGLMDGKRSFTLGDHFLFLTSSGGSTTITNLNAFESYEAVK
jgi:hypothetical protein